jgi:2-methylcitrate dehydratase PrpD
MDMNTSDLLVEDIYNLAAEPLPDHVVVQTKKCILDYLGAALAGSAMTKQKCGAYLDCFNANHGEATVIGHARKASIQNAALVNGYSAHITEMDDGHRFCGVHLGATIIPAVLATVEHLGLNGTDLLRGVCCGYETAIRIGRTAQPSHKEHGFHVSGTVGTIGAAVGVAVALGLNKDQLKSALSAGIAGAAGLLEVLEGESELKPYNIARAAFDGLTAAFLAKAGFKGPEDMIGGKRGFMAVLSDSHDMTGLARDADGSYGIEKIYRKPYAACRYCHAPIEAVLNLKARHPFTTESISGIVVHTYAAAIRGHNHRQVQGITSAKMSIPFSIAVALEHGSAGMDGFLPATITDRSICLLSEKVSVVEDKELSALVPGKRVAMVEIQTRDGKTMTERVDYPKGEPENPMSTREVEEKFISLALFGGRTPAEATAIIEGLWSIDQNMAGLFALL